MILPNNSFNHDNALDTLFAVKWK